MKRSIYIILLRTTITAAVGGVISLLPNSSASFTSLLGYKSLCTFNPASALYCFLLAGSSCFIRSTFFKYETGTASEKMKKHIHSLIPLVLILLLAGGATIWFVKVDRQYTDGTTEASIAE